MLTNSEIEKARRRMTRFLDDERSIEAILEAMKDIQRRAATLSEESESFEADSASIKLEMRKVAVRLWTAFLGNIRLTKGNTKRIEENIIKNLGTKRLKKLETISDAMGGANETFLEKAALFSWRKGKIRLHPAGLENYSAPGFSGIDVKGGKAFLLPESAYKNPGRSMLLSISSLVGGGEKPVGEARLFSLLRSKLADGKVTRQEVKRIAMASARLSKEKREALSAMLLAAEIV